MLPIWEKLPFSSCTLLQIKNKTKHKTTTNLALDWPQQAHTLIFSLLDCLYSWEHRKNIAISLRWVNTVLWTWWLQAEGTGSTQTALHWPERGRYGTFLHSQGEVRFFFFKWSLGHVSWNRKVSFGFVLAFLNIVSFCSSRTHYVLQAVSELTMILLPQRPQYWVTGTIYHNWISSSI